MRSAWKLLKRGLLLRCPACGHATLVRGVLRINDRCRTCGLVFEHDDGFFLGAMTVNYVFCAAIALLPALLAVATGRWSVLTAIVYACAVSLILPVILYWHAKSLWMALYYFFVPDDLRYRPSSDDTEAETAAVTSANGGPPLTAAQLEEQRMVEEAMAALEGGRPMRRRH